jgi:hypothetical protein
MKMTTPIPDGIGVPDSLDTSIGTLSLNDGIPTPESVQAIYDNLDFVNAVRAYLNVLPIASMAGMRDGLLELGPANTTVQIYETLMDSKALWLTPNNTSIYCVMWVELGDEPMVMETPPNVLGIIDDHWFLYVSDFGNAGRDEGKGGKYLLVPPGYDGDIPDGYLVTRPNTKGLWVPWRGFQKDGDTSAAVAEIKDKFKLYPLSQKDNPPELNFVNMSGTPNNTIGREDYQFWEDVNSVVQAEPADGQNPEVLGLLASIGIQKGKDFAPDDRMQKILTDAAKIGSATARAQMAYPRDDAFYWYPGESYWTTPFVGGSYEFEADGVRLLDARAFFHIYATGITPAMAIKKVGIGSQYGALFLDKDGNQLDGAKTYSITLPKDIPAKNFCSIVAYDNQTRSMLQTDQQFPAIDSIRGGFAANDDGSTTIYLGPKAPDGKEGNWIQTIPSKGWNALFRLYGPLEPWFDKSWRPGDAVLVE